MTKNSMESSRCVPSGPAGLADWFGVWDLAPGTGGACSCPRGVIRQESRDVSLLYPGSCDSPGKHPFALSGRGFARGLYDAVPVDQWELMWPGLRTLGVAPAAALHDDVWVLDVDGSAAWSGLVRLMKSGALTFDRVAAVASTKRGWHVWVPVEGGSGWKTGSAQAALNALLDSVRAPRGLEVKSAGGYVVCPGGMSGIRAWVPVDVWARRVAFSSSVSYGWGSQWAARGVSGVSGVAAGDGPRYDEVSSTGPVPSEAASTSPECFGLPEDFDLSVGLADVLESRMSTLRMRCAWLADATEGARNVTLNRVGYLEGVAAIEAGADIGEVVSMLIGAGLACGLPDGEVRATVRSSLRGGGIDV